MSREALILRHLETSLTEEPTVFATHLGVSQRTVENAVSRLNTLFGGAASVRLVNGRYRLYIVDVHRYGRIREQVLHREELLNDPLYRCGQVYARLLSATHPVRIDDLARDLSVSRSTLNTDLTTLRELLARHDVSIEGRPNSGLTLQGNEYNLRMAALTHFSAELCGPDELRWDISAAADEVCESWHLNRPSRTNILSWLKLTLDRLRLGHPIAGLPSEFDELRSSAVHAFAEDLLLATTNPYNITYVPEESLFLAVAAASMRTPDAPEGRELFPTSRDIPQLVDDIFERIRDVMGIDVSASDLMDEFSHHLSFMLARMRFRVEVDAEAVADISRQYPVAHQMALISREVLEERTGLDISDSEVGLMTSYFEVFLNTHQRQQSSQLHVAVVSGSGRVSGHLLRAQLSHVLPDSTEYLVMTRDDIAPGTFQNIDLVVSTPDIAHDLTSNDMPPVIELGQGFDETELIHKLSLLRLHHDVDIALAGAGPSLIATLLDPHRSVPLPPGTSYWSATEALLERLEVLGLTTPAFREALVDRERNASMLLDDKIGFPHTTVPGSDHIVLAMAVIPRHHGEPGPRAVIVMGVPDKTEYNDTILIDVYDEIIRLRADPDLLDNLSHLTSHEQLFWLLTDHLPQPPSQLRRTPGPQFQTT